MDFKIDKTALDKLKKDLTNLPQKVDGILKKSVESGTDYLLDSTTRFTPVDTGHLKGRWERIDNGAVRVENGKYISGIENDTEYAEYVNWGHRTVNGGFVKGRFFVQKGQEELRKEIPNILNFHIKKEVENWGK